MEIIKNQHGGLKLVHEGYMYTKKYAQKNVRWETVPDVLKGIGHCVRFK